VNREPDVQPTADGRVAMLMEPEDLAGFLLMATVGGLVYQIDGLELGLATYLALDDARAGRVPGSAMKQKTLEYLKYAMGDKVKDVVSRRLIDEELGKRLRRAVPERNKLMHLYFSEHATEMSSSDGKLRLAEELGSVAQRLHEIQVDLANAAGLADLLTWLRSAPADARELSKPFLELVASMVRESRRIPGRPRPQLP
jgi:hypothetical protein